MMTEEQIREKLNEIVKNLHLLKAKIQVEKNDIWTHIEISSGSFEGKTQSERDDLIWAELEKRFDNETLVSITRCHLLTPNELQSDLGIQNQLGIE